MNGKCPHCGKLLTQESLDPCKCHPDAEDRWPSQRVRIILICGFFLAAAALAAIVFRSPQVLAGFYLLPIGLAAFAPQSLSAITALASYLIYSAFIVSLFFARGKSLIFILIAFCVIVSISFVGCGKMVSSFSGIH
jgi:hypothetical protein